MIIQEQKVTNDKLLPVAADATEEEISENELKKKFYC